MKKILSSVALLFLITLHSSCEKEEITNTHLHQQLKTTTTFPLASANPYDELGELHNELFDIYLTSANTAYSIEDIATEVNYLISTTSNLKQTSIQIDSLFTGWVEQILNNPEHSLDNIVSQAGLSPATKSKFVNLIELASGVITANLHEALNAIISSEEDTIIDESLSTREKQIILTVSAIVKYSLYDNGDRKDKDWDLSVGNIVAAAYGAIYSDQDAIMLGLTTKIFQERVILNP